MNGRHVSWICSVLVAVVVGCAAKGRSGPGPEDADGGVPPEPPSFGGEAGVVDGNVDAGKIGCSGDLQNIVDEFGNVLHACGPDEGCLDAQCIRACDAAAGNPGSLGCDFRVSTPVGWHPADPRKFALDVGSQECFVAMIANGWRRSMRIDVSYGGQHFDTSTFGRIPKAGSDPRDWAPVPPDGLPPGQVAVLFLSDAPVNEGSPPPTAYHVSCPVTPAVAGSTGLHVWNRAITGRAKTFHIQTDAPANVYDIYPFGGAASYIASATLQYPTTAWSTSYVVISPTGSLFSPGGAYGAEGWGGNWLQVLAKEPTTVTINAPNGLPGSTLPDGGADGGVQGDIPPAPPYAPTSFRLAEGEYIQWNQAGNATGAVLTSDKPVSVMTGSGAFAVDWSDPVWLSVGNGFEMDAAHQQQLPLSALGSEYVLAPLGGGPSVAGRPARGLAASFSHPYLVVAAVDGTQITFDPKPDNIPANVTLNLGQAVSVYSKSPIRASSQDAQHPFAVQQYLLSSMFDGRTPLGGPEFVNVLPPQQFLRSYVFYTDVTYSTTSLVLVRVKGPNGYQEVNIDCIGVVGGWQDVGNRYQTAVVDLVLQNVQNGSCTNGAHTASSKAPFGITVWGLDEAVSYAYPAGGNATVLNQVPPPTGPR